MNPSFLPQQFKNPEEEIAYLRSKLLEREGHMKETGEQFSAPEILKTEVEEYKAIPAEKVLTPEHLLSQPEVGSIVLNLAPRATDEKISELLAIFLDKGLRNTLSVLEKMQNPSLDDDFHRFLVQYIASGQDLKDYRRVPEEMKGVDMVLFEISLPAEETGDKGKSFKELVSAMEQFYAGMLAISDGKDNSNKNYFSLEIALSAESDEIIFYAAVPRERRELFEKQIIGVYPKARLKEQVNDYNIFNNEGASFGMTAEFTETAALPIKTYDQFEADPVQVILSSFSKLKHTGEGAAVQFLIRPAGAKFIERYGKMLDKVKKGMTLKQVVKEESLAYRVGKSTLDFVFGSPKKEEKTHVSHVEEEAIRLIAEKIKSTILEANIRVIASAHTVERAQAIIKDIISGFHQFTETKGNQLTFDVKKARANTRLFHDFSYRIFRESESLPLNIKELTTLAHFPSSTEGSNQLKTAQAAQAPAPLDLPVSGTLIGINKYRGIETKIFMTPEDRMRHMYVIGQTGTGKTSILKNMIIQDIQNGDGCCFIDPHGTDVQDILAAIPPHRINDVIYFDPAYTPRPMGLNMLEYDVRFPEQKTFVVNELLGIFNKLFDMKTAGGPAFEQYFRNSALLVMDHPESGNTLLDISRVLSDKNYRAYKLSKCTIPSVLQFWANAEKTTGDQGLQNYVPYITNKFDNFLSNDIMRPVIAQEHSAFNFRDVMDNKKILLVNLSKGRLGDINANLIGLILVGKIQMAALSRVDMYGQKMNDFYLYIDEFQNVTTDSISSILSEARKYRLSLNIAHQYISQIPENIKGAVFGNVGSMAVFRVGVEDSEFLAKQFEPIFTANDLLKIESYNAYVKLLSRNIPQKPFNIATLAPFKGNPEIVAPLKELSYMTFGRDRAEIEAEIAQKYNPS
ncbi:MAG: hypothetical protein WAV09_02305 [Minisyncoccia bacterium]